MNNILHFPYVYLFGLPSLLALLYLCMFYFAGLAVDMRRSAGDLIKSISVPEIVSLAWLIGGALLIAIGPDQTDRRYVMFMVPMTILATITLFDHKKYINSMDLFIKDIIPNANKALLIIFSILLFYSFTVFTENFLTISVLLLAAFYAIAMIIDRMRGSHPSSSELTLFFWCSFIGLPLFMPVMTDESAFIGENSFLRPVPMFICLSTIFLLMNYVSFYKNKQKYVLYAIMITFIAFNTLINGFWLFRPEYSIYNASKYIGQVTKKGDVIAANYVHLLSLENNTFPLWWDPPREYFNLINKDNIRKFYPKYIILTDRFFDPYKNSTDKTRIFGVPLLGKKPVLIKRLHLIKYVGSSNFWKDPNLIGIRAEK